MRRHHVFALLLLISASMAGPACAENFEIGVIAPMTGPAASYGKDLMNGVNLAVDEINAAAGPTGRQLTLVIGDDRASPKDAAIVTQGFVSDPKILAMVGGITSTATFGATPVAQNGKLPFIITLASHPDLTKEGDYIFRNSITQEQEGPAIGKLVSICLGAKTVAIMYLNNDWGLAMTAEFKKSLDAAHIKTVAEESYDISDSIDYGAKLAKIKAANPDVIWFGSQYNDLALILKQAQRVNFGGKPMVASTAANSAGLIDIAGAAANNVYLHAPFSPASVDPNTRAFTETFERRYKVSPGIVSAQAYEAVRMVAREVQKGAVTREALRNALAAMPVYDGLSGAITFDAKTREADGKSFTPLVVKDKAFMLWTDCISKLRS